MTTAGRLRLAVDIGGTFVDAIAFHTGTGEVQLHKAPTVPADPSAGVLAAVRGLLDDLGEVETFVHGTTLGLNAVLQRRGADVGLITNEGFRDVLEVARADVPAARMYDFQYAPPPPLVRRRHRLGVPGRLDAHGREVEPLDEPAVLAAAHELVAVRGLRSIALCFLHSYADPAHEERAAALVRAAHPDVSLSVSSELSREYREYERTSTTALDAFIRPVLHDYVGRLEQHLVDGGFRGTFHIMRSGGGAMTADVARAAPLLTVLSGPAGGIAGAGQLAETFGWDRVISFDVGGTSVDACVITDGHPSDVHEAALDGLPLQIPVFDIRTIGAGGGSIAWMDEGLLKVGPQSAGADPGPACYGAGGTEPTFTDAALVLGYLDPEGFLGGRMALDVAAAEEALRTRVAEPLGLPLQEAAARVVAVLLARTVGAIREITVERGLDPRGFRLVAFGGAGPLIGPLLGREMGVAATVVPRFPAAFSALGMLMTDLECDLSSTVLTPLGPAELAGLEPLVKELRDRGDETLAAQGVPPERREVLVRLDLRYRGQEHSLTVDLGPGDDAAALADRFGALHHERYGHRLNEPCEVVTLRVRAVGRTTKPGLPALGPAPEGPSQTGTRMAYDVAAGAPVPFPVHRRDQLAPGRELAGPVIVQEPTSTTVAFGDQTLVVDDHGQLVVRERRS